MKKLMGLGAMLLASVLAMPGNPMLAGIVHAQEGSKQLTDEQYRQLQQKRQEQWQTLEEIQKRQENTGKRLQDAEKRRQDAEKRQKALEQDKKKMGE